MPVIDVTPVNNGQTGALQTMGPGQLAAAVDAQKRDLAASQTVTEEQATGLAAMIRREWEIMVRHRDGASGWSWRLLSALRQFNGQYEPEKLAEIRKFGGSETYARITAVKCRGASSLLRDVYLANDRPWGLSPPDDVEIPVSVFKNITELVTAEVQNVASTGQQLTLEQVRDRTMQLIEAARMAAKKNSAKKTKIAEEKVNTLLTEGNFYGAMGEFLADLPLFPFACLKGPVVKMEPIVNWRNGVPYVDTVPKLKWQRVSPFDVWFSPGVSNIAQATVIERVRMTRAELNDCLDLPGYDHDAVREVLVNYSRGYSEAWDSTDASRAVLESRENPVWNETGMIDCLEYHGNVQGQYLLDYGLEKKLIPDPVRDYATQIWMIGRYIIKVQLAPSPRKRTPYYITSFEKVPGTPVGNALPDMLADMQDGANAALRALVNNMAMSSGPQVVVNDERLSGLENGEDIYPWKRWHVTNDPLGGSSSVANAPITFFQPNDNSQNLFQVFQGFYAISDDISAIPRYVQGGSPGSGAGRTASGLAMLMGSSSKILQTVAANVDNDVIEPALHELLDMVLLTDETDMLDGTENVVVKGVTVALQRETQRSRQLEFLAATGNPIDTQIMGPQGRATVLRSVADTLGMPGAQIVPPAEDLAAQQQISAQIAAGQGQPGHGGMGEGPGNGNPAPGPSGDMGPRTNLAPTRIAGGAG